MTDVNSIKTWLGPCTNHGCVSTRDRTGMRTNGPCQCRRNIIAAAPEIVEFLASFESYIESDNPYKETDDIPTSLWYDFKDIIKVLKEKGR